MRQHRCRPTSTMSLLAHASFSSTGQEARPTVHRSAGGTAWSRQDRIVGACTNEYLAIPLIRTAGHPSAERRALQRQVHRGELTAVRPGVLVRPGDVAGLRPEERHLLLVRASAGTIRPPVEISHDPLRPSTGFRSSARPPTRSRSPIHDDVGARTTALTRVHGAPRRAQTDARWRDLRRRRPWTSKDRARPRWSGRSSTSRSHARSSKSSHDRCRAARPGRAPEMLRDEAAGRGERGQDKAAVAIGMGSALSGSPAESVPGPLPTARRARPRAAARLPTPGERTAVVDFWFPGTAWSSRWTAGEVRGPDDARWADHGRRPLAGEAARGLRAVVPRCPRRRPADLGGPDGSRAGATKLRRAGIPC